MVDLNTDCTLFRYFDFESVFLTSVDEEKLRLMFMLKYAIAMDFANEWFHIMNHDVIVKIKGCPLHVHNSPLRCSASKLNEFGEFCALHVKETLQHIIMLTFIKTAC